MISLKMLKLEVKYILHNMRTFKQILEAILEANAALDLTNKPNSGSSWRDLAAKAISNIDLLKEGDYLFMYWNGPALYKCNSIDDGMCKLTHVITAEQIYWPFNLVKKHFISFKHEASAPSDIPKPTTGGIGETKPILTNQLYIDYIELLKTDLELKDIIKTIAKKWNVDNYEVIKAIDINESIYKIQKPDSSVFTNISKDGTNATCTKCNHDNINPNTHVCTKLIKINNNNN